MLIDLRSDTLTKPTPGMLEAMFSAEVGDDVWEGDPTVKELENKMASLFGMEAGLFCPSGTMANQIAIRLHTQPQEEVICDGFSHIYHYEAAGPASNSGVSIKMIQTERGLLKAEQIEAVINPEDVHYPPSTLVVLENTCNKGGGYSYALKDLREIHSMSQSKGLKIHMDGARIFNAMISKGYHGPEVGHCVDSLSVCLSKGLGCPVGTVLLLNDGQQLFKAKRIRKAFGGGMRQAGYLAAAGIYALENHVKRLAEDHDRAKFLGRVLESASYCEEVKEVETNIVLFRPRGISREKLINDLKNNGILCVGMGGDWIRFVTHLDLSDPMIEEAGKVLETLS